MIKKNIPKNYKPTKNELMTGKEWYARFEKEIFSIGYRDIEQENGIFCVLRAGKKAAKLL
jgi:hypothetical protein